MSFALKDDAVYAYGDYLNWPAGERWELIDGQPYDMSPAPNRRHQKISMELSRQLAGFLDERPCEVYAAPFDVRLPQSAEADEDITDVVQPDISIICDASKLDEKGCRGAPDFIAEILSPSTAAKDQIQKRALYEKHGVREYWVIHPTDNLLTVRLLGEDGKYGIEQIYEGKGRQALAILPELEIDLDAVFRE